MEQGLGILAFSFIVAFVIVRILKPIAFWAELVDKPGGRKQHDGLIPLVGGIAIYLSVCLTTLVFLEQPIFIRLFLLAGGLIVFMGMLDDRYDLSARSRILGQTLICAIFVYGLDVKIESFGNLFGLGEIEAGMLSYPLTILSLMGAMNAFNFLDGMDGLVGSVAMVSFVGLVALFGNNGDANYQMLCMAFVGATGAFLIFNIWGKPTRRNIKKVFMGDAGSMFLGLSLGVLLVKGSQGESAAFSPITSLWLVLFPMTDMFTIMYRRFKRGRSPMSPDRTHIHHMLLRAGLKQKQTLNVVVLVQITFVVVGVAVIEYDFSEVFSFVLATSFVLAYQLIMQRYCRIIRWLKRRAA
ncbi:Undecaprenyl-phosphate alpha-N-acetylglucosaminyl 1-phosphate transferase [Thalassocella blandensis]|nr:Undecaprenyl-phosphate alpha-N-acetylglucosaminyl 1-phosphate transferase [Thalassocella blandensis]